MKRVLLLATALLVSGCAHSHLRWNTVKQSQSLTDIYEQQVLDNLAMFASNPHSIPHFALPSSGGSSIRDDGRATGLAFDQFWQNARLGASRTIDESWSLSPITDPDRLRRMRCAYQRAVGCVNATCEDCCDVRKTFLGKADKTIPLFDKGGDVALNPATGEPYEGTVETVEKVVIDKDTNKPVIIEVFDPTTQTMTTKERKVFVYQPVVVAPELLDRETVLVTRRVLQDPDNPNLSKDATVLVREEAQGRMTEKRIPVFDCDDACETHSCWFKVYRNTRVPKQCDGHIGKHGSMKIWVPASGRAQFGRLVLEIMEYALKDPPKKPTVTKEVTLYLDELGKPSNEKDAFQVVKASIPITEENVSLEKGRINNDVESNVSEDVRAEAAAERIQNNVKEIKTQRTPQFQDQYLRDFDLYQRTIFDR